MKIILFLILYLHNYDFEEWQNTIPLYWNVEHPQALPVFKESLNVYSGNYSVKIKKQSPTTSYRTALSQEIDSITGGIEYIFQIYVFDNDTNVYARIVIAWYKDSTYLTYSMTPASSDLNGWQLLSAIRQAPDSANRAFFKLNIYPVDTLHRTGEIYYDLAGFEFFSIGEIYPVAFKDKRFKNIIIRDIPKEKGIFDIFGRKRKSFKSGIYFQDKKKIIFIR